MLQSLEEYIVDMENRNSAINASLQSNSMSEDVWTQLRQKENDLVLAAELGNALLEENKELKKQKESLVDEYSKKLEEVEQDRYILKRKLTNKESELDARIIELEKDVTELNERLQQKDNLLKQWEKEKGGLLSDLNSQNTRLTMQLKEAANVEMQLQQQIDNLKEQCSLGKSNLHEHLSSMNALRNELEIVTERNKELDRRLHLAAAERDHMSSALEEASDRILLMERHAREQDMRFQQSLREYSLPQETLTIEEKLNASDRSILAEMDIQEPTLSEECMSVYRQLRSLVAQLKSQHDDDSGLHSDCSNASLEETNSQFSAGLLSEVAQELVTLVLDSDVMRLLERLEEARREIQERDVELQKRAERIMELNSKASVLEVELQAAQEDRDRARSDASNNTVSVEEVVAKAREDRDNAMERKTKAEVELARTRVDLMQANGQLMEAIQQKVELSQQLEQWQMDMHELLDEQLKNKLSSTEIKVRQATETPIVPPRRRFLNFFQLQR